ncbi:hypothetical protein Adt_00482 [Abeliophyllum distichum]|uniref:Uncharacterized protein n=1 Tax=Abeliophyllum distichum TaxID=126358 RepID=A0ABD1VQ62_9LAMI
MNDHDANVGRTRTSPICPNQGHPNFNVIITCSRLITTTEETQNIASLLGPPTWDSAKPQRISFFPSKGASPRCLALPPGTRINHSLSPSFLRREHRLAAWPTAAYLLPSFLRREHRLAAWPFHLGLGQIAAYLIPSFKGSIASLLGPPTWDSAKPQRIYFFPSKGASPRCLALPPGTRPNRSLSPSFLRREHRLAA